MRAICFLGGTCVIALVVAACGTTLGAKEEGLELLPGPPLAVEKPPEPAPSVEPLAAEGLEEVLDSVPPEEVDPPTPEEPPQEPLEPPEEVEPVNPFAEAVRLLLDERSVRMAVTATSVVPETGRELRVQSDGIFELSTFTGTIDVGTRNLARSLRDQASVAADFVPRQMVFVDNRVYLNYPELPAFAADQAPWASARYRELVGAPQWPAEGAVSGLALTTPAHVAGLLSTARKTLVEVGKQPIRGASATHYKAVADLGKLPAAAPDPTSGLLRGQARALVAALGSSELPIEVWLDDKGRLRRVSLDLGAAASSASTAVDPVEPSVAEPALADSAEPTNAAAAGAPAADVTLGETLEPEAVARLLEGVPSASQPRPSNVALVVDFITFSGRARAQAPPADETASYADVSRLARAVSALLAG